MYYINHFDIRTMETCLSSVQMVFQAPYFQKLNCLIDFNTYYTVLTISKPNFQKSLYPTKPYGKYFSGKDWVMKAIYLNGGSKWKMYLDL